MGGAASKGMIAVLSPAKRMRPVLAEPVALTKPRYLERAACLAETLRQFSPWQLESLLKINPELALGAFQDFQEFDPQKDGSAALLSYQGLAYQHLDAGSFTREDFAYANVCLRLLSAFYGVLLPSDGILPYRLELQCKFRMNGENLYRFWGDTVYQNLASSGTAILNLASGEYAKLFLPYLRAQDSCITVEFVTLHHGTYRTLATEAKMARGEMARYLVKERIESPERLKQFSWGGYEYAERMSGEQKMVFFRSGF